MGSECSVCGTVPCSGLAPELHLSVLRVFPVAHGVPSALSPAGSTGLHTVT